MGAARATGTRWSAGLWRRATAGTLVISGAVFVIATGVMLSLPVNVGF